MPDVYGTAQITGAVGELEKLHEAIILLDEHVRISGLKAPEDYAGHIFTSGDIPRGVYFISSVLEEPSHSRLEVAMKADYAETASKFLQGLASSFEFSIYWIHQVRGSDRQKVDFFAPLPGELKWRLRPESELEMLSSGYKGSSSSSLTRMNLSGGKQSPVKTMKSGSSVSEGKGDVIDQWSKETVQCLRGVAEMLEYKEQSARALQMPGNEETYRKLRRTINDIIMGGQDVLDTKIAEVSRQAASLSSMLL